MSWHYYNDYESAADRREKAQKKVEKLRKAGETIKPVAAFKTRGIATTFWGKAWCRHLEQFSDYESRLPRGRSYVRNGSVCHLGIDPEKVHALVSGSKLYELSIHIEPLCPAKWSNIRNECRGKVGSLIDLLQGKFPTEIMQIVTDPFDGLFPRPDEIRFSCNCPDWADMCKHVAAAMYGIGVRLDSQPELLFKLRGVNHEELISVQEAIGNLTAGPRSRRRRTLDSDSVGNVFGIDLDDSMPISEMEKATTHPLPAPPAFEPTGPCIRALREKLGLSRRSFAKKFRASPASVKRWENATEPLNLQDRFLRALEKLHRETYSVS
ncbi:MAG: helix-turn-helix domain-containing protein [Pontiellaceae bacterium]|nr:helix-turn-helix domain-containing protein [Pontiellaceae bacterium]MBN2784934.1 helix-turn-helix domain-containing protein [Pontiellaceae bacterium]